MGNLRDGVVDTKELRYTDEAAISCDRDLLNRGDVLFNRTNSLELVGKAALFDFEGRWAFASYLVRLVARRSVVLPEFLVALINSAPVRSRILSAATKGVSQANVNTKNLSKVQVKVPPLSVQERVVDALRELRRTEDMLSTRAKSVPAVGLLWGQRQQ
jgi:type I restriction enzyme S subunit